MPSGTHEKNRLHRNDTSDKVANRSVGATSQDVTMDGDIGSEGALPHPGYKPAEVTGYDARIRRFALTRLRKMQPSHSLEKTHKTKGVCHAT
jgi:hypothetical protein